MTPYIQLSVRRLCSTAYVTAAASALAVMTLGAPVTTPAAQRDKATAGTSSASEKRQWDSVGGDLGNTRHSPLTQINRDTIRTLGAAWVSAAFDDGATSRGTAVVANGRMFVSAGSRVHALDAKTGKRLWAYRTDPDVARDLEAATIVPVLASGQGLPAPPGVAVGAGLVFAGLTDGRLIALRETTGELVWSRQTGDDPPTANAQSISGAPIYANGAVFTPLGNGDFGRRGRVVATDAKTGKELWHFFTIPGPGEFGHDTWSPHNDAWKKGGGGVWLNGAADPELGLVYFGSGNAVPVEGGEVRPGDNLFTASVLALDMKTGTRRWHYQVVHHDLWDADVAVPLVLYEVRTGGRSRKGIAAMRADGYLFLLDRETGKPLWPVEERAVPQERSLYTSPTQPFPRNADSVLPPCETWKEKVPLGFVLGCHFAPPYRDRPNVVAPAFGVRVGAMAYNPDTAYMYVLGLDWLSVRRRVGDDPWLGTAGTTGFGLLDVEGAGVFAAVDTRTNKVVWRQQWPTRNTRGSGGVLSTAGGLVFRGTDEGLLEGHDALTGARVWQFDTGVVPARVASPSTYEVDGQQYIAFASGPVVWAFTLGGTIPERPRARSARVPTGGGLVQETNEIDTASLLGGPVLTGGRRYAVDEHSFNPLRARVNVGTAVTWTNNGVLSHTIAARDGSWTMVRLSPGDRASRTFTEPGTFLYICKDHPWAIGQLVIDPATVTAADPPAFPSSPPVPAGVGARDGWYTIAQAARGETAYSQQCGSCHGADLTGGGVVPALTGDAFLRPWRSRRVVDLFERLRTTMPQGSPGALSRNVYLDVLAYLLQANGIPSGAMELTDERLARPLPD